MTKMEQEDTKGMINRFLDNGCFHCAHCKELMLTMPIMTVENIGTVCSACHEQNFRDRLSLRNSALENAIRQCLFPCKFHTKGCDMWCSYEQLLSHEELCKHRSKKCPMFKMTNCSWEGFPIEFVNHFLSEHGDHIIYFDNNLFILETSITERELVKLLVMKHHIFVLRMQTNLDQNNMHYVICNIRDDMPNYEYSVKHKGNSDNYIKTKSRVLNSNNIYSDFDESLAVNIAIEALKQTVLVTDTVTHIFKIKVNESPTHYMEELLLQHFECPICKGLMKPPIYQCQAGHSICSTCRPRVDNCPTCRCCFNGTRNYSLESLTSGVQYPCAYHELGCTETCSAAEVARHEALCPHKPFDCPLAGPLADCSMNGPQSEIVSHLINSHGNQVIRSDSHVYIGTFRLEQRSLYDPYCERKVFLAFGHIFRTTCKRMMDHSFWAVEIIGPQDKSKEFIYEVSIIDTRRPEKKLIRTDYCLKEMSQDELLKKCIMFPNSILSAYSGNGIVTSHLKIRQK